MVSMGTPTGLQLCSPICNKLRCTVYSDTFLSEPALISSAISVSVNHLLVRTTRASLAPHMQQWALATHDPVAGSPLFLPWTTFDRYQPQQNGNALQELQFLEMLRPSCLAITIWPLSNSLKSLHLSILPAYKTSTLRTTCSLAA